MANEIRLNLSLSLENGQLKHSVKPGLCQIDQATPGLFSQVIDVGLTEEEYTVFGDVSTPGLCVLENLDTTNFVSWGTTDGGTGLSNPVGKLKPCDIALFRLDPGAALTFQANTAPCKVLLVVYED